MGRGAESDRRRKPASTAHGATDATATAASESTDDRVDTVRCRPGPRSAGALDSLITDVANDVVTGPAGVGPFSAVLDAVLGARRLAGWALWVELAAIAKLITAWRGAPPVLYARLEPDPSEASEPGLAERLQRVVSDLDLSCLPDSAPLDTAELAEEFVLSEVAAATGLSFYRTRQYVDAAIALFLTDRLPRTAVLLRAGLLDWTKLQTLISGTAGLDEQTCRVVEARVINDDDVDVADPLDVHADPAHPGTALPAVTKMTNPALERAVTREVQAVDAEAAARRAQKAREQRSVTAKPLADGMGRLEVRTGQEIIAAILGDLDNQVASAKATGDARRPDQIRCDELVHRMTFGAYGAPAIQRSTPAGPDGPDEPGEPDLAAGPGASGEPAGSTSSFEQPDSAFSSPPDPQPTRHGRWGRRGLHVGLTMPLSTWLGLTEEPGLPDGYGPIPAALARQIAAEAGRDHPTTTSWRRVITDDRHRTVLGVGDLIPTPRHDPPPRLARLMAIAEPRCVYPGCPAQAWRCDLDHRKPFEQGGPTCSCNLQPLCRRHHRLKGSGLISVRAITPAEDPGVPVGTVEWSTWTGRTYRHQPPEVAAAPVRPGELAHAARVEADQVRDEAVLSHSTVLDEQYDQDWALRDWDLSLRKLQERPPQPTQESKEPRPGCAPRTTPPDDPPPF
jgi:Domain of unknown function (DUF222)